MSQHCAGELAFLVPASIMLVPPVLRQALCVLRQQVWFWACCPGGLCIALFGAPAGCCAHLCWADCSSGSYQATLFRMDIQ